MVSTVTVSRSLQVSPLFTYQSVAQFSHGLTFALAIQMRAIVPCTKGHDVIAQAQSGTGKTATFAISCLQNIDVELHATQALILGPTRELAQQIQKVSSMSYKRNLMSLTVFSQSNRSQKSSNLYPRSSFPWVTTWVPLATPVSVVTT